MLNSIIATIISNVNNYFLVDNNLPLNYSFSVDRFIVSNNLFGIATPILILFTFLLIYKFLKIRSANNNEFVEDYPKEDSKNKETQLYFLFLGLIIPFLEIIFAYFNVRSKSLLLPNCTLGVFYLIVYFISKKSTLVFHNIQLIFKVIFIITFCLISRNLIFTSTDITPIIAFIIWFFFSYDIVKPIKLYWFFITSVFTFICILYSFELIPTKSSIILFNYSLIIQVINYVRHKFKLNNIYKFRFTNEIVNKGNSLTIATNTIGEVSFCSETINSILGYSVEEVMGFEFWKLTEDSEFNSENFLENHIDEKNYIRKLKCKNGAYKYIQWKNRKHSENLIIAIGNDISNEIEIRNQYHDLIQNATDIIFEVDYYGNFTFINNFTIKILGYNSKEALNRNYLEFIRKDYINNMMDFYENLPEEENDFTTIEIPLIKKNGEELWVSQKVIVRRNNLGKIIGYSGIARDITSLKNDEIESKKSQEKIERYNSTIKKLSTTNFKNYKNFRQISKIIIEAAAKASNCNRVSYWKYTENEIILKKMYDLDTDEYGEKVILNKEKFPIYFEYVKTKAEIIVPDVFNKWEVSEFKENYFTKQNH